VFKTHYAILDAKGNARPCGEDRHRTWFCKNGSGRVRIQFKLLDDFLIETVFDGEARLLEFDEPSFWHVRVTRPAMPALTGGFWGALNSDIHRAFTSESETLAEILKKNGTQNILYEREFSTREDTLIHHHEAVRTIREHQRTGRPEHAQMLLADLTDWCSEQRGRQTQIARAIGVSPQAVNDFLFGYRCFDCVHGFLLCALSAV